MTMLRRSRRLVAAFLAPLYAVVTAAPATFHQCAMHSAGAARAQAGVAAAHADAGGHSAHTMAGHSMAGHTMAAAAPAAGTSDGTSMPSHGGTNSCSCDDGCCVSSVAATAPRVALLVVPEAVRREGQQLGSAGVAATSTQIVLPFANGPPARV